MSKQFYPSALKPLEKQYKLENIAVMDIETNRWPDYDDIKNMSIEEVTERWHNKPITPFLVSFYDTITKNEKTFDGVDCMKDFLKYYLQKKYRNRITYAHNGGKFDFIKLYEIMVTDTYFHKYTPKLIYVNGGIMVFRIKDKNKNVWQFRDSYFLLNSSLKKLSESFKPEKQKLTMPAYPYHEHKEKWQRYCMHDCKALAEILQKFNDIVINQLHGSIGLTTSSTAMRTFRLRYLKQEIPTYFTWNNFIREGYYGGRVEVFNMYAPLAEYYYYDVNSMYSSIMHDNIFPVSAPRRVSYDDPWDCVGKCGYMECEIETPEELYIPVLPYRNINDHGKLIFPLGKWKGTYEFSLIEKALKLGYQIKPLRTIEFEGEHLFAEYADDIYTIKKNSEKGSAMYMISKLFGNGLYGKFGEHSERDELVTEDNADILGTYPIPNDLMGYTTKKIIKYSAHHLPAIAGRVTALAQLKLYDGLEMVQKRGGTVYYCDTDSMITDLKMKDSKELGQWGLECQVTRGVFFAPKAYCIEFLDKDGNIQIQQRLKGFTRDFQKTLRFEDYRKALPPLNDYSAFMEPRVSPCSFKEISTRKLKGFSTVVKPRTIQSEYSKRSFYDDYSTKPLLVLD